MRDEFFNIPLYEKHNMMSDDRYIEETKHENILADQSLTLIETLMPMLASSAQRYRNTKGIAMTSISPPFLLLPNTFFEGIETGKALSLEGRYGVSPPSSFLARASSSSASARHTRQYSPVEVDDLARWEGEISVPSLTSSNPSEMSEPHVRHTQAVE